MASYHTAGSVPLDPARPLVIVDADEVLFRFVEGLDAYLAGRGLYLDLTSYRLHGNVKRRSDGMALDDETVSALLSEFREGRDDLAPVPGAVEAVIALRTHAQAVVLSNVTESEAPARRRNLDAAGLAIPLAINNGLKGPAVAQLAARAGAPAFFVDDIPHNLTSAAEHAPHVFRIHLVGDDRLRPLLPPARDAHFHAGDWAAAEAFIRQHLDRGG